MDFNNIANTMLKIVVDSTKGEVESAIDQLSAAVVQAVKNSETTIDDLLVKDVVVPALKRLAAGVEAGLAAV